MSDCLFCKIRDGEIPAEIVHSDEHCLAFKDLNPVAPLHLLVIPRSHIATTNDIGPDQAGEMGALLAAIPGIAAAHGVEEGGYRLVINCNREGGQQVFHLHVHLLGGRQMTWPPG